MSIKNSPQNPAIQLAFLADIHFHDIYGEFADGKFKGVPNSVSGKNAILRTMEAQVKSTRLLNENYFALSAALDQIVARGIKIVILLGDLTDDGQPIHMRGLAELLNKYRERHGLKYYGTLGNHDIVRPYGKDGGKPDFLGTNGKKQAIYSKVRAYSRASPDENPVIASEEVSLLGYKELMAYLPNTGFYPSEDNIYWESPFSSHTIESYDYSRALKEAKLDNRLYEIYREGSGGKYKGENYTNPLKVPDSSYLVECEKDLWFISIDANIFIPKEKISVYNDDPDNYHSSSNAGYNKLITHKRFIISWIKDVVDRSRKMDKILIAFGHYPVVDFYEECSREIEQIFGQNKFQVERVPTESVSKIFAEIGIKIHFSGHMHFNDTGFKRYDNNFIINIVVPSLAAYIPAYKIVTLKQKNIMEVETIILDEVPHFNELFENYQTEHSHLSSIDYKNIWNKDILNASSYKELNEWHIRELTRIRFLPDDWPEDVEKMAHSLNGLDMLTLSQMSTDTTIESTGFDPSTTSDARFQKEFEKAKTQIKNIIQKEGFKVEDWTAWKGFDLIVDFYKLRNADKFCLRNDILPDRIDQYRMLLRYINSDQIELEVKDDGNFKNNSLDALFKRRFYWIIQVLDKFTHGEPSDHFLINLNAGNIVEI